MSKKTPEFIRAVHRVITVPADHLDAWLYAAAAEGQTLSAWLGDAARRALPPDVRRGLSARRGPGRPRKSDTGV